MFFGYYPNWMQGPATEEITDPITYKTSDFSRRCRRRLSVPIISETLVSFVGTNVELERKGRRGEALIMFAITTITYQILARRVGAVTRQREMSLQRPQRRGGRVVEDDRRAPDLLAVCLQDIFLTPSSVRVRVIIVGSVNKARRYLTLKTNGEVLDRRTPHAIADARGVPVDAFELVFEDAHWLFGAHEDDYCLVEISIGQLMLSIILLETRGRVKLLPRRL